MVWEERADGGRGTERRGGIERMAGKLWLGCNKTKIYLFLKSNKIFIEQINLDLLLNLNDKDSVSAS